MNFHVMRLRMVDPDQGKYNMKYNRWRRRSRFQEMIVTTVKVQKRTLRRENMEHREHNMVKERSRVLTKPMKRTRWKFQKR